MRAASPPLPALWPPALSPWAGVCGGSSASAASSAEAAHRSFHRRFFAAGSFAGVVAANFASAWAGATGCNDAACDGDCLAPFPAGEDLARPGDFAAPLGGDALSAAKPGLVHQQEEIRWQRTHLVRHTHRAGCTPKWPQQLQLPT